MEHAGILADIESQLTQAAELVLSGGIPEALFASVIRGALAMLPMPLAPRHIPVLRKLKEWKDTELILAPVYQQQLQAAVVGASRPPTEDTGSSNAAAPSAPARAAPAQGDR